MMNQTELALIVPSDPALATVRLFAIGEDYHWLADAVEGMISCVTLSNGVEMWVNDEYLYNGSEMNPFATAEYWLTYGPFSHIVNGTAVFTTSNDEGDTTGLTWAQFDNLASILLSEFGADLDLTPILANRT